MLVEQILPRARERLVRVDVKAPIGRAADLMAKPHADLLVVCDGGAMVGVVTKTDIVAQYGRLAPDAQVAAIMTREVACCLPTDRLPDVWSLMRARGFQRIPVVDAMRNPMGVVYTHDALQGLLREVEIEDQTLRDYIAGVGYR